MLLAIGWILFVSWFWMGKRGREPGWLSFEVVAEATQMRARNHQPMTFPVQIVMRLQRLGLVTALHGIDQSSMSLERGTTQTSRWRPHPMLTADSRDGSMRCTGRATPLSRQLTSRPRRLGRAPGGTRRRGA